jgi:hypothetical protein
LVRVYDNGDISAFEVENDLNRNGDLVTFGQDWYFWRPFKFRIVPKKEYTVTFDISPLDLAMKRT